MVNRLHKRPLSYLLFFLCIFTLSFTQAPDFQHKVLKDMFYDTTTEITCYHHNKTVGYLQTTQLPFSMYVIHSFFVYPEYRNQGYGTKLLNYTCAHLHQRKARSLFIQPGPFEYSNDTFERITDPSERKAKMEQLIKLYTRAGFHTVSRPIASLVAIAYKCCGIPEDARYLMVSA